MSYRPGGETEKLGNFYEDNVLIYYYGQMLEGKYMSVKSESFDRELEQGGDIYLRDNENRVTVVQAKSRNGNNDLWSVSVLIQKGIIKNACHHILQGRKFVLASPLSFILLQDLCSHSMAFDNYDEFKKAVITNEIAQDLIKLENEISKYFNDKDVISFFKYFSLKQFADNFEDFRIAFQGSVKAMDGGYKAFQLLRHYAINHGKLSQDIYADELLRYLYNNGVKQYVVDEQSATKQIVDLGKEYRTNIRRKLINKKNHPRKEFSDLIKRLSEKNIVIIHGKAGTGKSGIVLQLCEYLDSNNNLYLPISLDARMPNGSSHDFGKQLGLNASPVTVLSKLSDQRTGYLIIDQLDAIRWNITHSTSAISVCCELVREARYYRNIKLVFVCRTIDAEKVLSFFDGESPKLSDCAVKVGLLTDSEVQGIIGRNIYSGLAPNIRKMLTNINNLRMFMNIDGKHIERESDIIREYVNKKLSEIQDTNHSEVQARELLKFLVDRMRELNVQAIARNEIESIFGADLLEKFCSYGITDENNSKIRFAHQSILDYYFAQELEKGINNHGDVVKIISHYNDTAIRDYEVLKQYFEFVELNSYNYVGIINTILFSTRICSFIRHIALESFRTTSHDDSNTIELAFKILRCKRYGKKYLYYLMLSNYSFAKEYVRTTDFIELEKSTEAEDRRAIVDILCFLSSQDEMYVSNLRKYVNTITEDINTLSHLFYQIDDMSASDKMFDLKFSLLTMLPTQLSHIHWKSVLSLTPCRAGKYIEYILDNKLDLEYHFDWEQSSNSLVNIVQMDYAKYLFMAKEFLIASCNEWELKGYIDFKYHFTKAMAQNILEVALEFATTEELLNFLYSPHMLFRIVALHCMAHSQATSVLPTFEQLIDDEYIKTIDFRRNKSQLGYLCEIVKNNCLGLKPQYLERLIDQIKLYKSPRLLEFAKDRFEQRKNGHYYHFFEEEQKILLCAIPFANLDNSTREYVKYLLRKFPTPEYYSNFSDCMVGACRSVVSGIAKTSSKFSAKTWEQILVNPRTGKRSRFDNEIDESGNYVEYGRESFESAISMAASLKQPMFVEIALKRDDIPRDFINAICSGLSKNEASIKQQYSNMGNIDIGNINARLDVFKKYFDITDKHFLHSFVTFIENYDITDAWVETKLLEIANSPDKYESVEMNVWRADWDKKLDSLTTSDLEIEKINRVQTCAIAALANTLSTKQHLPDPIKCIINDCLKAKHPVLLFSLVDLICPIWNFDKSFAIETFTKLLNKDIRVICGYKTLRLLDYAVTKHAEQFYDILRKAITAGGRYLDDIGSRIAYYYCYYNIYGDLVQEVVKLKPDCVFSCCIDVIKNCDDAQKQNRAQKLLLSIEAKTACRTSPHSLVDVLLDSANNEEFAMSILDKMIPLKEHDWYGLLSDLNDIVCLSGRYKLILKLCSVATLKSTITTYEANMLVAIVVKLYAELYDKGEHRKWKKCLKQINKLYDMFVMDTLNVVNKIN